MGRNHSVLWIVWIALAIALPCCTLAGNDVLFPEQDVPAGDTQSELPTPLRLLIDQRCSGNGCHTQGNAAAGLDLDPGKEISSLVNVPATTNPTAVRVVPGDVENSYLVWRLRELQGTTAMPPSYATEPGPLVETDIALFEEWIAGLSPTVPPSNDVVEPPDTNNDVRADTGQDTVVFLETVDEVFAEYCTPCHVGSVAYKDPKLGVDVYADNLINVPVPKKTGVVYVSPGDLENSYLLWRLGGLNDQKYMPPPPFDPVPAVHITIVQDWILSLEPTACEPKCENKSCGDDGCGGSCGDCLSGEECNSEGQCAPPCVPACGGKSCGDDGCGESCGECNSGEACSDEGQCVAPQVPTEVALVFATYCTGCHTDGGDEADLSLDVGIAYENLVGVTATTDPSLARVSPGKADKSMLMWRLEGSNGVDLMPDGANEKIPEGDIDAVENWINGLSSGDSP